MNAPAATTIAPSPAAATSGFGVGIVPTQVTETDSGSTDAILTVQASSEDPGTVCSSSPFDECDEPPVQICVGYRTIAGSATAGVDFVPQNDILVFSASGFADSGVIRVPVLGDDVVEGIETFSAELSYSDACPPNAAIRSFRAEGRILDDDEAEHPELPPSISIDDVTQFEGPVAPRRFSFAVRLSHASDEDVSVGFTTVPGTATPAACVHGCSGDFVSSAGTVTLPAGETSAAVKVTVVQDLIAEPDETFQVTPSAAANAVIVDGEANGTIRNDD